MSPAAKRLYVVGFESRTKCETIVEATSKRDAIARGKALYELDGLLYFWESARREEPWGAQVVKEEVRS